MVLESVMICLDNSEWMRNGDYAPTRLEAQQDAAGMICNDRTGSNPENTVGVLTMAGRGVDLLVSPTEDSGKLLACFTRVTTGGKSDFSSSVQIAQLALKHRKNKNGSQRIIVFVGSPLQEEIAALQKIGKQLKKNNVAVDVITFGELEDNSEKLMEFINSTNSNDNCHLIAVPPGVLPADAIQSSPIMHLSGGSGMGSGSGASMGMGGGGAFDDYGGVDPSMDPELAMAIRASTEEARAQEEARVQAATLESGGPGSSSSSAGTSSSATAEEDDEEALMQRALELSMRDMSTEENNASASAGTGGAGGDVRHASTAHNGDEDEEDAALRMALELSMASSLPQQTPTTSTAAAASADPNSSSFLDSAFVSQLLESVDVDHNDPLFQAALAQLNEGALKDDKKEEEGKGGEEDKSNRKRKGDDGV